MLAFITSYWFVTLPGVLTGLYLLKTFSNARVKKESKKRIPVNVRNRK